MRAKSQQGRAKGQLSAVGMLDFWKMGGGTSAVRMNLIPLS
jgi:hypothetical protein